MTEHIIEELSSEIGDAFTVAQNKLLQRTLSDILQNYDITLTMQINSELWKVDLERFLERKAISGKSERTVERYRYVMTKVLSFIDKPIDKIHCEDINDFLIHYKKEHGVSNNTLEGFRLCISSFFTWQYERGYIPMNPSRGVDPIKVPKLIKQKYSDEDFERIRRFPDNVRNTAIVEMLYTTGIRVSELCSLNRDDVKLKEKEIVVFGKGAKERKVYLTSVSAMYVREYLKTREDEDPALFVSLRKPHKRLSPSGIRSMLKKIGRRLGTRVYPHKFRTTLATNLIRKGMPLEEVKQILGHEKMDTTLLYALVDQDKAKSDLNRLLSA